jgi:tRNA (cmo5U34)-methyltransferase
MKKNFDKKINYKKKWTFSGNVAQSFDGHIKKSVPMFEEFHWLTREYAKYFIKDDSYIYDIGCATGKFINNLSKDFGNKKTKFIGIDIEKNMIKFAKKNYQNENLKFFNSDILKYNFKKTDLFISLFTIQFIHQKNRQLIIKKMYDSLNWGGAILIAEKVRSFDARTQDMSNQIYNDWKRKSGFDSHQILNKTASLAGVMDPFSTNGNLKLFKNAGFKDISTVAKYICFELFLLIK